MGARTSYLASDRLAFCDPVTLSGPDVEISKLNDARSVTRMMAQRCCPTYSWNCNADDRDNHKIQLKIVHILSRKLSVSTFPFKLVVTRI